MRKVVLEQGDRRQDRSRRVRPAPGGWASALFDVHQWRLELLRFLAGRESGATVAELAETFGITAAAVRGHLQRLADAGLVDVGVEGSARPGRPRHLYRASAAGAQTVAGEWLGALLEVSAEPAAAGCAQASTDSQ